MTTDMTLFKYPTEWNIKREPARPKELRVCNFEKTYDYDTLWNDIIQINNNTIVCIGPPLYQTVDFLEQNCKFMDDENQFLDWQHISLDRVSVVAFRVTKPIKFLKITCYNNQYILPVNKPSFDFQNKKVAVTICKNTEISWIKQWLEYHKVVYNLEGALLYNNQSTMYTTPELQDALQREDMKVTVVDYDVPFGTLGGGAWEWDGKKGDSLPWDSDFSQYVMLEHAKWRYLFCADLVLNMDLDELLLTNGKTLDELSYICKNGDYSTLLYQGIWIEPVNVYTQTEAKYENPDVRHFKNYYMTANQVHKGVPIKYMLCPGRNITNQWLLHRTSGPYIHTKDVTYGHFMAMNTGWSWKRDTYTQDKELLVPVEELKNNLNKVWK
jgi:hypothetical protein